MLFRAAFLIASVFLLTSCANMGYIVKTYHGVKVVNYQARDQKVRIFDKPAEGKLMITSTVGRAAAMGAGAGATLWTWKPGSDINPMQQAAQQYLDSTGRICVVTAGKLLVIPQWEFIYTEK